MPSVFITGANRGLGLEFARQYAADQWKVIATCRNPDQAEELNSLGVHVLQLDVECAKSIEAAATAVEGQAIDLLLCNAGMYPKGYHFGGLDYDSWEETFRVNTLGPIRLAETFVEHVKGSTQKKIVAVTSKMGSIEDNGSGGSYAYRSSKAALNAAFKSLSIDLAPDGITTAVLHPGWVKTDMGSESAPLSPGESIRGMRQVVEELSPKQSGGFFAFDGTTIPW